MARTVTAERALRTASGGAYERHGQLKQAAASLANALKSRSGSGLKR